MRPVEIPEASYAKTIDGVFIAYQVDGDEPVDLAWQMGWPGNIDLEWEWPLMGRWLGGLATFSRLILHDHRGVGLSSRSVALPNLETRVADLHLVLDAVAAERVVLAGESNDGAVNALFAATDPHPSSEAAYIASLMPRPELETVPGAPYSAERDDAMLEAIRRFVGVAPTVPDLDRVLASVLFTDIVGSTERLSDVGDAEWRSILARHDERARSEIERHRGRYIDSTGDGLFATFDGPARVVRCAPAIGASVRDLGIQIRAIRAPSAVFAHRDYGAIGLSSGFPVTPRKVELARRDSRAPIRVASPAAGGAA